MLSCGTKKTRERGSEGDEEVGREKQSGRGRGGLEEKAGMGRERTEDDALKTDGQRPFQVNGGFRLTKAKVGAISRFAHGKRGYWCPRLQ